VFRRSEGSAPFDFVLISVPLVGAFSLVLWLTILGYRETLLYAAANALAERSALADVKAADLDELVSQVVADLGVIGAKVEITRSASVAIAEAKLPEAFGITLSATGLASVEE
jgi:hypothetical protein